MIAEILYPTLVGSEVTIPSPIGHPLSWYIIPDYRAFSIGHASCSRFHCSFLNHKGAALFVNGLLRSSFVIRPFSFTILPL